MTRSLDDLLAEGVSGRRVLVRTDLNVPLDKQTREITDDGRIRASLPTLQALRDAGARITVAAHLGRPKGAPDPRYSLAPVAARLSELLGAEVPLSSDVAGEDATVKNDGLRGGDVLLLENVRFEPGETKNDEQLARRYAALADAYVNDAFGAAHRAHASTEGIVKHVEHAAAGLLFQHEVDTIRLIMQHPDRPLLAIIGGAKVTEKIGVIDKFLEIADRVR